MKVSNLPSKILFWIPDWITGGIAKNTFTRQNGYSGVTNKFTTDELEPLPSGIPDWTYPDNPAWTEVQHTGSVSSGFRVSGLTEAFSVTAFRVWIPSISPTAHYRILKIDNNTGARKNTSPFNGDRFGNIGWHDAPIDPVFLVPGNDFTFLLVSQNSSLTTDFNHPWNNLGEDNSDTDPGARNVSIRRNRANVRISYTDSDNMDRSAAVISAIPGTTLKMVSDVDSDVFYEFEITENTDNTTWALVEVTLLNIGPNGSPGVEEVELFFQVPVAAPTDYVQLAGRFTGNLFIQGVLQLDQGTPVFNDVGNGLDAFIQRYIASPDWDLLTTPSVPVGSIDSEGVFTEAVTLTIEDSGQVFVINQTGTLFANDADVVIDSTRYGVKPGHGNYDVAGSFFDTSGITQPTQVFFKCIYDPQNNGDMGMEVRAYSDKNDIPASLVLTQTSSYKTVKGGNDNEMTVMFHYDPDSFPVEALQIFGVASQAENVTLRFFVMFFNKLRQ